MSFMTFMTPVSEFESYALIFQNTFQQKKDIIFSSIILPVCLTDLSYLGLSLSCFFQL